MDYISSLTGRQCDPTWKSICEVPCSSSLQTPPPYNSTSLHNDLGRTMPRHKSLPSIKSTMFSISSSPTRTSVVGRERSGSTSTTTSLRRSVSGMKSLLPLKLSSSVPTSTFNSPTPLQRSTFGFQDHPEKDTAIRRSHRSSKRRYQVPRPITIRREQYRDTPIYTEPGSPLLNLAYYTDQQVCLDSSAESCDETSSIHGYTSSTCESDDLEDLDEETPLPEGLSPMRMDRRTSRSSELSFKCLGESTRPLIPDEGAWLSSPLDRWYSSKRDPFPQFLADNMPVEHDLEECVSPTSSICEDDLYACATSVAPARAQVVDVNSIPLSFKIPPRSSSLVRRRPQSPSSDNGRKSRMAFRENHMDNNTLRSWIEDSVIKEQWVHQPPLPRNSPDLAMATPPLSPSHTPYLMQQKQMDVGSHTNAWSDDFKPPRSSDSISRILSDLNRLTSDFPLSTLLPDDPCVTAIRVHLEQSSQSQWELPAPPQSPFSEGVDWRPRPKSLFRRPKTSVLRKYSSSTSRTVPLSEEDWNQPIQDVLETPTHSHQRSRSTPTEPNLHPLAAIFPNTSYELRSELYAHILAYLFLTSLPDQYQLPQDHNPHPSPPYALPFYTTTPQSFPDKAADRLGIFIPADKSRRINVGGDAIILRKSEEGSGVGSLLERIRSSIGSLIVEMRNDEGWPEEEAGPDVDAAFLRALGEVVKGCERECFEISRV